MVYCGALAFASSEKFQKLESLYMGQNNITDQGAVALIESQHFPQLKVLDLILNPLGEGTMLAAFKANRKGKVQIVYR